MSTRFPLIMQNIHRYFFYPACLFIFFLFHDAWHAMRFTGDDGQLHFGIGVGTIVLTLNAILLAGYTFGCHCMRHLIGGRHDSLARRPVQRACYDCVSCPQSPAHGLGVDEPGLRRIHRRLREAVLDGHLDRLEDPLVAFPVQEFRGLETALVPVPVRPSPEFEAALA